MQSAVLDRFYAEAEGDPKRLPWYRSEPDALLARIASGRTRGRALDVGCGGGELASYLARLGYAVTAIDLHPEAVAMAKRRAAAGPSFEVLQADVLQFTSHTVFDFVLDSGCLHTLRNVATAAYRTQLLTWLAPGGDFVLEHWDKRGPLDWRPIGPHRRSRDRIEAMFASRLDLVEYASEEFSAPFPIGPRVLGTVYHFRHGSRAE